MTKDTPVVVFSHSPIQKIYKGWNFWTEDAEEVQALLQPFDNVTVVYGHVHQIQYNQIGNISFHAVMATAWPWPYPQSYAQAESHLPKLTVPMNRADPFFERDATGWQFIDLDDRPGGHGLQPLQQHQPDRGLQPEDRPARGHDVPGRRERGSRRRSTTRRRSDVEATLAGFAGIVAAVALILVGFALRPTSSPRRTWSAGRTST